MNQDFNPILFAFLLEFTLAVPGVFAQGAAGTPVPLPEAPAPGAPEARPRRVPVDPAVDAFYKLGPDSMPMDGVPKGKFTEAKVLPSQVFPGTQHTYIQYLAGSRTARHDGQQFRGDRGVQRRMVPA